MMSILATHMQCLGTLFDHLHEWVDNNFRQLGHVCLQPFWACLFVSPSHNLIELTEIMMFTGRH